MPRHTLKLLALLTAFTVGPAAAGQRIGPAPNTNNRAPDSGCPHERARLAAALAWSQPAATPKRPTRITLLEGSRSESPLPNVAPGRFFTP